MSVNKVILVGNLGADPEVYFMPNSNSAVVTLSVATSMRRKNRETGETYTETEWHRVKCFDQLAEFATEYLAKGYQVYVEGRLRTRKWNTEDGEVRYTTEIIANNLQLVSKPRGERATEPEDAETVAA